MVLSAIGFVFVLPILFAYLLGSIPFGLILSKFFAKTDITKVGSGNIGATNVLRTGNKTLAFLTLVLDGAKGAVALFLLNEYWHGFLLSTYENSANAPSALLLIYGFAAIIGHCCPVWLKFKGGKGVATTLGTLLAAVPLAGVAACLTWLVTALIFKISSLSALVAMIVAPLVVFYVQGVFAGIICVLISTVVFWKHRENIQRLIKSEEPKISFKKKEPS
ncbi:MAG: glycerol-3-phosphate 1-O-acyltransferase PlsY [Pseudomonadota bacterium]